MACLIWSGEVQGNDVLITCEHGGNAVPAAYQTLFRGERKRLRSHYGYDAGALVLARTLAASLDAPILYSTTSRLLVDLNRPVGHPRLFSEITRNLSSETRAGIIREHHKPHWQQLERLVSRSQEGGRRLIHISSHSFTPELHGHLRRADVGLLYDPARLGERSLCARWRAALTVQAPELRVRRNYPYLGKAAGLTAQMRRCFPEASYIGIELEVNQSIVFAAGRRWAEVRDALSRSLLTALTGGR